MDKLKILLALVFLIFLSSNSLAVKKRTDHTLHKKPIQTEKKINKKKVEREEILELEEKRGESNHKGNNLWSTVKQGGVMIFFLIFLGLIGLTIIIERIIYYLRKGLWKKERVVEYLSEVASNSKSKFKEQLEEELRDAWQLYLNKMERGLVLLNGIGGVAPIIGFLGTVLGMIKAFAAIAAATTVNAKVVAVGIQIALVTTAGGLIVAAPLLASFYFFSHIIQHISTQADKFISRAVTRLPSFLDQK